MILMQDVQTAITAQRIQAIAAARAAVGTRFRPLGRLPGVGLDCVGVVLLAAQVSGVCLDSVPSYALGGDHADVLDSTLVSLGFERVGEPQPADVVVFSLASRHRHLAVISDRGIVHAHAGLGRVVEGPMPDWPIIAFWSFLTSR
jgi:cell wall-associated NlpC family hydrolase